MKFKFKMSELRSYSTVYAVEADTLAEAEEKAQRGETIEEEPDESFDVVERFIDERTS